MYNKRGQVGISRPITLGHIILCKPLFSIGYRVANTPSETVLAYLFFRRVVRIETARNKQTENGQVRKVCGGAK